MELPAIKIPQIELPFDIPALLHSPVDHFIIALPIVVLLLEIINLFAKKRAIGVVSFFLLILTVVAAVAAYFTGTVDGTAAWDLLSKDAQGALKAHKLFGTYLMLASAVVLLFKLFSAMIQRGLMKAVYLLVLIVFVAGILKQGKEGGELVYKYGANVERVKALDDEMFDLKDELADYKAEEKEAEEEAKQAEGEAKAEAAKDVEAVKTEEKEETATSSTEPATTPAVENNATTAVPATPAVEVVPESAVPTPEVATH